MIDLLGKMVTAKGLQSPGVGPSQPRKDQKAKRTETTWDLFKDPAQFCDLRRGTQNQVASELRLVMKFPGLSLNCRLLQT